MTFPSATPGPDQLSLLATDSAPDPEKLKVREAFQDFVAGTFYMQMLKSMRKMHGKAAYLHGGQAEQIFQGQLDQQIAEDLARNQGAAFADPLFQAFEQRLRLSPAAVPALPQGG